jgi:hypothetical protein
MKNVLSKMYRNFYFIGPGFLYFTALGHGVDQTLCINGFFGFHQRQSI